MFIGNDSVCMGWLVMSKLILIDLFSLRQKLSLQESINENCLFLYKSNKNKGLLELIFLSHR